jgi:fatty acid desaturase
MPIPEKRNIAIFLAAYPATWGLLWLASHGSIAWALVAAWAFAFVNHTPFSLMHEAVHGVFSPNQARNNFFGTLSISHVVYVAENCAHWASPAQSNG